MGSETKRTCVLCWATSQQECAGTADTEGRTFAEPCGPFVTRARPTPTADGEADFAEIERYIRSDAKTVADRGNALVSLGNIRAALRARPALPAMVVTQQMVEAAYTAWESFKPPANDVSGYGAMRDAIAAALDVCVPAKPDAAGEECALWCGKASCVGHCNNLGPRALPADVQAVVERVRESVEHWDSPGFEQATVSVAVADLRTLLAHLTRQDAP